jgi:ankyrin repeat protein
MPSRYVYSFLTFLLALSCQAMETISLEEQLFRATAANNIQMVEVLLSCQGCPTACDINGSLAPGSWPGATLLHYAARYGLYWIAQLVLSAGALCNSTDAYGATPLHYAAAQGQWDIARLLLQAGAEHTVRDNTSNTPIWHALVAGYPDIVNLLVEHGATLEEESLALIKATWHGRESIVRWILERKKARIDAHDFQGLTALHYAILTGRAGILRILLKHGASPDTVDRYKRTPLHYAALYGRFDCALMLLHHGASVTAADTKQATPLHYAALAGHAALVGLLLEHGAVLALPPTILSQHAVDLIVPLRVSVPHEAYAEFSTLFNSDQIA